MPKFGKRYYSKEVRAAVKWVKKSLDDNPTNGITTLILASEAGISRNMLQEVFKHYYGTTIGQYRLRLRMSHAKRLLGAGKSIKEIAITLQYSSVSAFTNAFRKYYGQSPTEWRLRRR